MRINNNKKYFLIISIAMLLCFFSFRSFAHDFWIEVNDFSPEKGKDVKIKLAYDHEFPAKDVMDDKNLKEIYMLDPENSRIDVKKGSEKEYEVAQDLKENGPYIIAVEPKARFWTKTTEGYKSDHTKKGLKNAVSCTYSHKYSKAIINKDKREGNTIADPVGHDLEIIPLVNPAMLHAGENLPVKILLKGNPLASNEIYATYMGYKAEKNKYAYTTKTSAEGEAVIKMLNKGVWLVKTSYGEDYQNQDDCDINKYSATLTFELE